LRASVVASSSDPLAWFGPIISSPVPSSILHAEEEPTGAITCYKYFMILMSASFVWLFLPAYLFQALSIFSFMCWISPDNVPIN
jgi:hypothetical protein